MYLSACLFDREREASSLLFRQVEEVQRREEGWKRGMERLKKERDRQEERVTQLESETQKRYQK